MEEEGESQRGKDMIGRSYGDLETQTRRASERLEDRPKNRVGEEEE